VVCIFLQFFIDLWEWLKSPGEVGVTGGVVTSTPVLHRYQHLHEERGSGGGGEEVLVRRARAEDNCVFAPAMSAFKCLETEMGENLVEHILTVASTNSTRYKAEK